MLNEASDFARIGPDEEILKQGEVSSELIFLVAGSLAASTAMKDGRRSVTDVISPIRAVGCAAVLLGRPAPVGYHTIASSRLILVPLATLRPMVERDANLARRFLDHVLHELDTLQEETCELKLLSSAQRLAGYLLGLATDPEAGPARFVLPYEKRFLAGKIGCSQENLSRAFAALRRLGVETQRGIVVLRDVPALRDFAGLATPQEVSGEP
jgi:CRP-like cAMP-binding protein